MLALLAVVLIIHRARGVATASLSAVLFIIHSACDFHSGRGEVSALLAVMLIIHRATALLAVLLINHSGCAKASALSAALFVIYSARGILVQPEIILSAHGSIR